MTNEVEKAQDITLTESEDILSNITPPNYESRKASSAAMLLDMQYFEQIQRVANMLKGSSMIPEHYRNLSDCAVATHMAYTSGIDPIFLMQNTQVVKGKIGWKGQAIIALLNSAKRYTADLEWDFVKDDDGNVISATCFTEGVDGKRKEATVNWDMVKGEGWDRNNKWQTMREQMFCYRSATFFARRHCPDILLGIAVVDEFIDITANVEMAKESLGKTEKAAALNAMAEKKEPAKSLFESAEVKK